MSKDTRLPYQHWAPVRTEKRITVLENLVENQRLRLERLEKAVLSDDFSARVAASKTPKPMGDDLDMSIRPQPTPTNWQVWGAVFEVMKGEVNASLARALTDKVTSRLLPSSRFSSPLS